MSDQMSMSSVPATCFSYSSSLAYRGALAAPASTTSRAPMTRTRRAGGWVFTRKRMNTTPKTTAATATPIFQWKVSW